MPEFKLKIDDRKRITLPDAVMDGLGAVGEEINLSPNTVTALLHRKDIPLEDVIKSTELLLKTLKHRVELQRKNHAV